MDAVGFIGDRKNTGVQVPNSDQAQTARMDYVPLTRDLIDRLVPENHRLRRVLLMEHARGRVTRRIATELFERTGDDELGHLLGFFYDTVQSAELGDDELTYDLSVPDNVTYVANGFVSHNTIGLLMDCDTTGVEPDLGLVKTKKLVGGGTMSIVNQTVPRALTKLGYGPEQIEDIVGPHQRAHVDRRGPTPVVGASGGVRLLHGRQHHPLPRPHPDDGGGPALHHRRDLQDGEHARGRHRRGRRAAPPRRLAARHQGRRHLPGQLQGGPAPVDHQEGGGSVGEGGDFAPPGSEAEARDREIAARIAELEAALITSAAGRGTARGGGGARAPAPQAQVVAPSRSGWPTARAT